MIQPHQQRVVDEKSELDEKRVKLLKFISDPGTPFSRLDIDEQRRLGLQLHYMDEYSTVLGERIARFT